MRAGNRALFRTGQFPHTNVGLHLYLYRYINLLSSMLFIIYQHFQRDRTVVANFAIVFLFYFVKPFQYLSPGFPVCSLVIRPANRTLQVDAVTTVALLSPVGEAPQPTGC